MESYAFYVYGAYGLAAAVTISITAWTWADGRARRRELIALETGGFHRRSSQPKGDE